MRSFKMESSLYVGIGLVALAWGLSGCFKQGEAPMQPGQGGEAAPGSATSTPSQDEHAAAGGGAMQGDTRTADGKKQGKPATASEAEKSGGFTVGAGAPGAAPTAVQAPPKEDHCYTAVYKHEDLPAHRDGEACLSHENLFKLDGEELNMKSVCVRVNGTPVRHKLVKGKPGLVVIGAVAGPQSEVQVRYCTGKLTCKEDCTVPRDEFMDAIGGAADTGVGYVDWNPKGGRKGPSGDEVALEKEMSALNAAAGGTGGQNVFKGWISRSKPQVACESGKKDRSVAASSR